MTENLAGWPTKLEAARELGIDVRTLERKHIAAGQIEVRERRRDRKRPEPVCNPADVERLKPATHLMPAAAATRELQLPEKSGSLGALELIAAFAATLQQARSAPARPQPRWLTVDEYAARSGLSGRLLKLAVKDEQHRAALNAWRDGRKWKLDAWTLETYTPSELPRLARSSGRAAKKSPQ